MGGLVARMQHSGFNPQLGTVQCLERESRSWHPVSWQAVTPPRRGRTRLYKSVCFLFAKVLEEPATCPHGESPVKGQGAVTGCRWVKASILSPLPSRSSLVRGGARTGPQPRCICTHIWGSRAARCHSGSRRSSRKVAGASPFRSP